MSQVESNWKGLHILIVRDFLQYTSMCKHLSITGIFQLLALEYIGNTGDLTL